MVRRRRVRPAVTVFPAVHGLAVFRRAVVQGGLPDNFFARGLGLGEETLELLSGDSLATLEGGGGLPRLRQGFGGQGLSFDKVTAGAIRLRQGFGGRTLLR